MKESPVIEIVEVDGVLDSAVVCVAGFREDAGAGGVVVNVAIDCGIVGGDGVGVEGAIGLDPLLALDIGRFF